MKRCSNCGMINPDTAARCRQCGSVLQPPGIRCPKCGTVNPATQTECSRCHTRLPAPDQRPRPGTPQGTEKIAPSAVKGFSVPEKPPAEPVQAEDADLPDWLRSLMGDSPSTEQPAQATAPQSAPRPSVQKDTEPLPGRGQAAATSTPPAQEELPDWLAKLMGDQPPAAEAAADQEAPTSDDLPTWLQQSETPDTETAADSGAAVDEAWMARLLGMESPAPEPSSDEGAPAVASAPQATPEEESPEPAAELPDWLTAIMPEAGETAEPSAWVADAASKELTATQDDQVFENPSPEEAEPEGSAESTPASALNADGISSSAEGGEPGSDAEAFDGIAIPNWQAGVGDGEKAPDSRAEDEEPEPEGLLPDWMREVEPLAEMSEHPLEPADKTETMPATEAEEPSAPKATGEPGLELPSWTNDLLGENPEPLSSTVTEPELTPTEELPTELPEWLADLSSESAKAPVFSGSEGELEPETEPDQAGPGWLKDVTPPPGTLSVRASTPALIGGEGEPPEPPVSEPALADVAVQEAAAPDWLAELTPPSPETPVEEAPVPAPAEAEELARAEVPAWLQGLRPPGSAPLPTLAQDEQPAPAASQGVPGELVEAEIPEWLQALRPQVGTGGGLIEAAARLEAPEELGPLAGIAGLLPALAVMDLPAEHKPTLGHAIPDSVYQQAQLWQDLLTHPRGVEQPVIRAPQRHRVAPMALRLVLVLLLAVAALAGFLLLPQGQPLSQVPSPSARPWINDLYQIVEGLPAGEKVLVAVEYGPAEAIELGTVAQGILEHLNARQADVTLVSTLPEGVALIPGLLDVVSMTNSTLLDRPTYVVGEASGVARVLAQAKDEAVTRVIVISSRLDRLQWWIEQSTVTKVPVSVGTAASMGPWVRAYLETEQTQGGIIGYAEVQAYRGLRQAETPGSDRVLDVLMLTHWVALGFLALGFLYYLVAGKKGSG